MSAYMFRSAEIFVALMVSCAAIWAQSAARINGRVTDATGAVIPGAEIRVTQTDTNAVRTTTSGEDGSYVLADLPIGPYTLDARKEGFTKYRQSGIVLQVGSNPTIDVPLSVGNVTEQVEVRLMPLSWILIQRAWGK